jgi:hypothetical protein
MSIAVKMEYSAYHPTRSKNRGICKLWAVEKQKCIRCYLRLKSARTFKKLLHIYKTSDYLVMREEDQYKAQLEEYIDEK